MNYQYNIGCSLSNLKGIREFVRTSLKDQHVPEIEMSAIVLALDEMCSNLMIHAHHCNPDHMLELHIVIPAVGKFIFEIVDDGSLFDINEFHEPELGNWFTKNARGFGHKAGKGHYG